MSDTRPPFISFPKAPLWAAFFFLLGLPACNPSWVTDPLSKYLKNKTGIEFRVERISVGIHPLLLETKGIQMRYQKDPFSWEVNIPELQVALDWTLSWEELPWPQLHIEKILINHTSVLVRMPQPVKEGDWTVWLKKLPILKQIEVNDLKGRLEIGKMDLQLAPETRIKASFSPEEGGKIEYQISSLQGGWNSGGIKFRTKSQGTFELYDLQAQPKWKGSLKVSDGNLQFKTGKISQVSGSFSVRYQDHTFEIFAAPAQAQKMDWSGTRASFSGQGNLALTGTVRHRGTGKNAWTLSGINIKFNELDFNFEQGTRLIKGRTEGQARLHGPALTPTINGRLSARQTEMDLPPVFTHGLETEIDFQGKFPFFSFPVVRARAGQTDWQLTRGPLSVVNPETRFSAQMNMESRRISLNEITLKTENWNPLSGSLLFDLNKGPVPQGTARSENFPILKFFKHFFPRITEPFFDEIPCQGAITWSHETAFSPIDFSVSIAPVPFSFQFPQTDWEGEDLEAMIQGGGKWFFKEKKVQLNLNHTFSGGSLSRSLWNFNFEQNPLKGRFEATIDGRELMGSITGSLGLQYDPLGEITVYGEWPFGSSPHSYSGSIELNNLPLERGFPLLVGEPLSDDYPFWEKVSLGGLLNARLFLLKKEKYFDLKGRMTGSGIELAVQDSSFSLQNGSLDLPFHFSSPDHDPGEGESSESGFIQVENFQGFRINLNKLRFSVLAGINRFEIPEKTAFPLWGGRGNMNFFKLSNPFGDLKIESAVSLEGLDLAQMFQGQGISGTLQGDLGPIRIDKEKAQIEGKLKAQAFEGQIEGKNWVIGRPFAPDRDIQGELYFSHLNLEPVTRRFSFGKITGFVNGRVTDLVLRYNRPERFHLQVNTQEIPGVPKIISIKAVENIGLLGTGWGELDVLRKGINRFISEYAYREIGLSCTLEEGLFRLRGTIIEDGVEYLVRKPNWFGIDVINKNPDNEILFSDILERIRNMEKKPSGENRR
jgi:hypothetical protein